MLPSIRRSIKSNVSKNRPLKDILSPTAEALEVTSVEALNYHVYNTKAIVKVLENNIEEDRILFYNRLDIETLLQGVVIIGETTEDVIKDLNGKGYDFTTADITWDVNKVVAVPTSLGYMGEFTPSGV